VIDGGSWPLPPLYTLLQRAGEVSDLEMRDVFNLGVGMVVVLPADQVAAVQSAASSAAVRSWVLGNVRRGTRAVTWSAGA
jgi:phosphoribosylformylglycinamidine cyclo-ligase